MKRTGVASCQAAVYALHARRCGGGRPDNRAPDPVVMPRGSAILMCDFCDAKHPAWAIPLTTRADMVVFTETFEMTARDDGWWAACAICAKLITDHKVRLLRQRSIERLEAVTHQKAGPEAAIMIRMTQARFLAVQAGCAGTDGEVSKMGESRAWMWLEAVRRFSCPFCGAHRGESCMSIPEDVLKTEPRPLLKPHEPRLSLLACPVTRCHFEIEPG